MTDQVATITIVTSESEDHASTALVRSWEVPPDAAARIGDLLCHLAGAPIDERITTVGHLVDLANADGGTVSLEPGD